MREEDQQARASLGCVSSSSYASFVLSKLSVCIHNSIYARMAWNNSLITKWQQLVHENIWNFWLTAKLLGYIWKARLFCFVFVTLALACWLLAKRSPPWEKFGNCSLVSATNCRIEFSNMNSQLNSTGMLQLKCNCTHHVIYARLCVYLTIIPQEHLGYHLISNKHEWNNCFVKTPPKYRKLNDFPRLECWANAREIISLFYLSFLAFPYKRWENYA